MKRGAAVILEISNRPYVPLHDLLGHVIGLFDLQGRQVEAYDYSAFGKGLKEGITTWLYASKRLHPEAGLIFFGSRSRFFVALLAFSFLVLQFHP